MIKLVCFDFDDTLTREIHSVMLLCMLNGKLQQLLEIERLEEDGRLGWIEADYKKAALIKGLSVSSINEGFNNIMKPLYKITDTVEKLKENSVKSIIVSAGPKQVVSVAKSTWNFDNSYGSDYEVSEGKFTGRILKHIGDKGKIDCLKDYCLQNRISPNECAAVGDGSTDLHLFEYCKYSIAINASDAVADKATYSLKTDILYDIVPFIID